MSEILLHQQLLDNSLELIFYDLSNRYYGDFHQIKIEVVSRIKFSDALLEDFGFSEREQLQAKNRYGEMFEARQELKRMGVAGSEVQSVTTQMVKQFLDSSLPYMSDLKFPQRLLRKHLSDRSNIRSVNG